MSVPQNVTLDVVRSTVGEIPGAAAGYANYSMKVLMGQTDGWDWKELAKSTLVGMGTGSAIGGLSSGIAYGLSEKFQWSTYKKVYDRGMATNREQDIASYIAEREGIRRGSVNVDLSRDYIEVDDPQAKKEKVFAEGKTNSLNGDITIYRGATKTASNFYETVAHEGIHQDIALLDSRNKMQMFQRCTAAEEAYVRDQLLSHRYSEFWPIEHNKQITQIKYLLNGNFGKNVKRTLDLYGINNHLYY